MRAVVITGMSATGKSTLAKKLANRLNYRLISKDVIKENLFAGGTRQTTLFGNWRHFETASLEVLYKEVEKAISSNQSIIVESNFHSPELRHLELILREVPAKQIVCQANGWVTFRRFRQRQRHGGHGKRIWYPSFVLFALLPSLAKRTYPPASFIEQSNTLLVDTTDFDALDYESILAFLKA
jgi:predicted kinase